MDQKHNGDAQRNAEHFAPNQKYARNETIYGQ